ncbi:MAG: electron transfer flavoprotein subunit alpha/FixB family protein [Chloroflexi bacterium]|nr:electron transfer flavoprotein subunit alpha/FixB family protein [Chloroflexota bacterium]
MAHTNAVFVVAEAQNGGLATISAELLGAGRAIANALGGPLVAALVGHNVASLAAQLGELGADRVLVADDPLLADYQVESYAPLIGQSVRSLAPAAVLLGQTFTGRELGPRLAFDLETAVATDCVRLSVEGDRVVMAKPVYGGNAVAEYVVQTSPQVATLRARAFEPAAPQAGRRGEVEQLPVQLDPAALRARVVETVRAASTGGPNLKEARVIVAGGRGLGGPENWRHVEELAQALGAAVGATRAVTDAGWVPASLQVGLTGVTVSPDLYLTIGISGAVQHLAGITGAKNVVAINRDPEANIFKVARFGVVGDWKQVLPAFTRKVQELRGR